MRRFSVLIGFVLTFALVTAPDLSAQWLPASCSVDDSDGDIRGGRGELERAVREEDPAERQERMDNALERLTKALVEKGHVDKSGAWYYLGRYYILERDAVGADSAFDRATELAPDCEADISLYRRSLWGDLLNQASQNLSAGDMDGAIELLRLADIAYQEEYNAVLALGEMLLVQGQDEEALPYLKRGIETAEAQGLDTLDQVRTSLFNVARVHQRRMEWDSALGAYQRYLDRNPTDVAALASLAGVYVEMANAETADSAQAEGLRTQANAIFQQVMVNADQTDALTLFHAGNSLYNGQVYDKAAEAYELSLQKNPFFREALFNVTIAYLETEQPEKALETAGRLVQLDPLNKNSLALLGDAHRDLENRDQAVEVYTQVRDMPLEVNVIRFSLGEQEAQFIAQVTNHTESAVPGVTIRCEFLDAAGNVLHSETVETGEIASGDAAGFELNPQVPGIVGWRYALGG